MRVTLFLPLLLLGCTSVNYTRTDNAGEKVSFKTSSFATRKTLKEVEYSTGTNSTRNFKLKGYGNNQTEAIEAAIAAALEAYTRQQSASTNR